MFWALEVLGYMLDQSRSPSNACGLHPVAEHGSQKLSRNFTTISPYQFTWRRGAPKAPLHRPSPQGPSLHIEFLTCWCTRVCVGRLGTCPRRNNLVSTIQSIWTLNALLHHVNAGPFMQTSLNLPATVNTRGSHWQ